MHPFFVIPSSYLRHVFVMPSSWGHFWSSRLELVSFRPRRGMSRRGPVCDHALNCIVRENAIISIETCIYSSSYLRHLFVIPSSYLPHTFVMLQILFVTCICLAALVVFFPPRMRPLRNAGLNFTCPFGALFGQTGPSRCHQ